MILHQTLLPLLDRISQSRVLCVGDVMLDQFVYGDTSRISPEAPVPVLSVTKRGYTPGGVGNVAANLSAMGVRTDLISVTGDDQNASQLGNILESFEGLTAHLLRDAARPTTFKTRYIASGQHVLRVDEEKIVALSSDIEDRVLKTTQRLLADVQVLVISDYGKGCLTPRVLSGLITAANKQNVTVIVDPKGYDYTRYRGADVITPNRKELSEAAGNMATKTDADIEAAAAQIMKDTGIPAVVATRSADGVSVICKKEQPIHLRTQAREVFDVSGAGDTFVAGLAAALAAKAEIADAAELANIAAGLAVEKVGTAIVREGDIRGFITEGDMSRSRIFSWDQARDQMARWHAKGLKVGFTNGCFDLLHQGHVLMLERCRRECDRLIVGVNCDASVGRLKGPTRPVNPEYARAQVIAALGSVDAVVLFGQNADENDTPLKIMQALRPDVIFKGQDYTIDKVVGADFVQSYGGRVALIPLEDGFSTTATIQKMGSAA
ncbi:MAG TPA: D-glycero-beta-D-manno-heptose-7-phosphate kinase [Alphaproteobacteria bacterium]